MQSWPRRRSRPSSRSRSRPGRPRPAPPVGTALGPHGVAIMDFCKEYNARDRGAAGHDRPGRDHVFEDRTFTLHHQDAADPGAAAPGRRARQGLRDRRARTVAVRSPRPRSPRSPRPRCPTSTPTTSTRPSCRSPAPPARWASRSSDRTPVRHAAAPHRRAAGSDLARRVRAHTEGARGRHGARARSTSTRPSASTASSCTPGAEAVELVKTWPPATSTSPSSVAVRLGVDPRKADQMVRGTVALPVGHGQGRAGRRVRRRATPPPRPGTPAPTSSAPTTWPPRSRGACSTSTSPSPRPTSCRSSGGSAGCSAPAA